MICDSRLKKRFLRNKLIDHYPLFPVFYCWAYNSGNLSRDPYKDIEVKDMSLDVLPKCFRPYDYKDIMRLVLLPLPFLFSYRYQGMPRPSREFNIQ